MNRRVIVRTGPRFSSGACSPVPGRRPLKEERTGKYMSGVWAETDSRQGMKPYKYYTMYYAKQKIYETPQLSMQCVSAETGFAASEQTYSGACDTDSLSEKTYEW